MQNDERSAAMMVASGLAILAAVLAVQYFSVSFLKYGGNLVLPAEGSAAFAAAALPTFGIVVIGIAISIVGFYWLTSSWKLLEKSGNVMARTKRHITEAMGEKKKVFWIALSAYALVFLFASNSLVYSPEPISAKYSVAVPSYTLIGCCGQPGSFPVLTVYVTDHFGALLFPANMILLSYLTLLVAINTALLANRIAPSKMNVSSAGRNMTFCGISVGVLAGCPTCVGSIVLSLAGGSSAASIAAATLVGYQPAFVIASIGALLAAPLIIELR